MHFLFFVEWVSKYILLSFIQELVKIFLEHNMDDGDSKHSVSIIIILTVLGIIGWEIYNQFKMMASTPQDLHWFIFMITVLIFLFFIIVGIFVLFFKFEKISDASSQKTVQFEEKFSTIFLNIDKITDSLQQSNNNYNELMSIVSDIQETINNKDIPKIKNELENIHLRTQNILVRCLKIIISYHRECDELINNGISKQMAKMQAVETANESFKEIKQYYIEDIYKSCLGLNEMIKLNIMDLIDHQNKEMKKVLTDDSLTCEDKISTILYLNEELCDSIYTTCRHNITITEE